MLLLLQIKEITQEPQLDSIKYQNQSITCSDNKP